MFFLYFLKQRNATPKKSCLNHKLCHCPRKVGFQSSIYLKKWVVHNTGIQRIDPFVPLPTLQTNESTSHSNREVRKSSSSQKVPKITASLYLLFPRYRVSFSNPHLGIQDILVGIMPVTCLPKSNIAGGRLVDSKIFGTKTTLRLCFPCCLKSLKRPCYEDLSRTKARKKGFGRNACFLLHKRSCLQKQKIIHLWQPNNEQKGW